MQHIVIAPSKGAQSASEAFLVPNTREAIELAVEAFLDRLDELDGDPDLEDDDPAGDPLDKGELDESHGIPAPQYGIDQTKGPINEREAMNAYFESQRDRRYA